MKMLQLYTVAVTAVLAIVLMSGFQGTNNARFGEITVERINVVDKDGHNRMIISNESRMPGPIQRGQEWAPNSGGRTGMLFYNEEGTENGGLIFSGHKTNGKVTAVGSLTFDQYEQDQTIALQYVDDGGSRRAGLNITDYSPNISLKEFIDRNNEINKMPDGPEKTAARQQFRALLPRSRLYVGRARDDGSSLVSLSDANGRERLRLRVRTDGESAIEFLDNQGKVVRSLTASDVR
jgi:hypothetical protein